MTIVAGKPCAWETPPSPLSTGHVTSPDIFATFMVEHYGAKERRNMVRVIDEKTGAESWMPLFDETGAALYPELMNEFDGIKRERIGGLTLRCDWSRKNERDHPHCRPAR